MICKFCDSEQASPCETMGDVFLCPNTTLDVSRPTRQTESKAIAVARADSGSKRNEPGGKTRRC